MIVDQVQRWELGREYRRPAGEVIRTSEYEVAEIAEERVARAFVETHHYSRTCSPPAHRHGLYRRSELVGVACFGPPPSTNAHHAVWPLLAMSEAVTLGRFVLLDGVPGNGESWFLSRSFDLLRKRGVVGVESCSDPYPRRTTDGTVRHRGHVGTIYQATNGRYVGRTNPASLVLLPDGTVYNNRAQGKLVRGERGGQRAHATLVRWGADPLAPGEDARMWLKRWRKQICRPLRHPGNHRYLWVLEARRERELLSYGPALPYPKIELAAA